MNFTSLLKSKALKTPPKEVWIGWVSSLVEAYNMAIYSFMAPLLAPLIFQQDNSRERCFFLLFSRAHWLLLSLSLGSYLLWFHWR